MVPHIHFFAIVLFVALVTGRADARGPLGVDSTRVYDGVTEVAPEPEPEPEPAPAPAPAPAPVPEPALAPAPAPTPAPVPASEPVPAATTSEKPEKKSEKWYDRINIRGYTQVRYNRLPSAVRNDNLINLQGDRSIGGGNGFIIRRARVILFGDLHPRVSIYFQPDFASVIGEQLGVTILRDWYTDLHLDRKREFRIRLGQSKVPFGFENMQSSQNRLPLDRNDALNSTVRDERDLGAFFYWAPDRIRKRFDHLVSSGLKGSGDYGVIGLGVYNGQTANRPTRSDNLHAVARVTWPFAIGKQFVELGGGGYYGKYTVSLAEQSDGTTYETSNADNKLTDTRGHAAFVLYPKPFGIQAEYNVGMGPAQSRWDNTFITERFLHGGYVTLSYKIDEPFKTDAIIPYARGTIYEGGKKFMPNAPHYSVRELEAGIEWQIIKWVEVVVAYMVADRTSDRYPYNQEYGHVTRIQVQVNY
jgi:hypothetical protein